MQKYQIKNIYKLIVGESPRCSCNNWVWSRQAVPKHNFICWLAVQSRLYTRDRLVKWGVTNDDKCPICQDVDETHHRLWFQCTFSLRLVQYILGWLKIRWMNKQLQSWYKWLSRRRTSLFQRKVINAALNATVYAAWSVRNDVVWNFRVRPPWMCVWEN